ncbi:unnamed protein product [Peniophora sp. CBMAI 1063]|nr:unnamed protein product [Peniophora sp. CBMAI 1063]
MATDNCPAWVWENAGVPSAKDALSLPEGADWISPHASVVELCATPFPSALTPQMTEKWNSMDDHALDPLFTMQPPANCDLAFVRAIPPPPQNIVQRLASLAPNYVRMGCLSIKTEYLVPAPTVITVPLWIITLWTSYYHIQPHYQCWNSAMITYMEIRSKKVGNGSSTMPLSVETMQALRATPWSRALRGFPELPKSETPLTILCAFLTQAWLDDKQMAVLLALTRLRLLMHSSSTFKTLQSSFFFPKLEQIYKERELYGRETTWVYKLGTELSASKGLLAMPVNIGQLHWVAVTIDFASHEVRHGDSLGGDIPRSVRDILRWWTEAHAGSPFKIRTLPITRQSDGFSCGILVANALSHALLGDRLLSSDLAGKQEAVDQRLRALIEVLRRHNSHVTSNTDAKTPVPVALAPLQDNELFALLEARARAEIERLALEHSRLTEQLRSRMVQPETEVPVVDLSSAWEGPIHDLQSLPEREELACLNQKLQHITLLKEAEQKRTDEYVEETLNDACKTGIVQSWSRPTMHEDLERCLNAHHAAISARKLELEADLAHEKAKLSTIEQLFSE